MDLDPTPPSFDVNTTRYRDRVVMQVLLTSRDPEVNVLDHHNIPRKTSPKLAQAKAKQSEATNKQHQASRLHLAPVLPHPPHLRAIRNTAPHHEQHQTSTINLFTLHSLTAMPARLPTTQDFPSTVKASIVPRKYVKATPSSNPQIRHPVRPRLRPVEPKTLSGPKHAETRETLRVWTPAL
jgi:hypothetical protein